MGYYAEIAAGQMLQEYAWRSAGKSARRVPPFKVTQGRRNRHASIGYLSLPIIDPS